MIAVLAALSPGRTLEPADLRAIVEQLESQPLEETSLGFGWASRLVDLGRPDAEMRMRLVAAALIPADRLDVGFISFNDRLIDTGILAGDYAAAKRLVGDACIEVLRKGVDALGGSEPLLEPHDVEVLFDRLSEIGLPRDQQEVAARLAATLLPDLILHERDRLRTTGICRGWRALDPPEELIRELVGLLIESLRGTQPITKDRTRLLLAALELEPSPEQRSQVAEIIVDEILAGNTGIDSSILGRVTISGDGLRRLASAGSVPRPLLRAAASSTRRSMPLAGWTAILPELGRGEISIA